MVTMGEFQLALRAATSSGDSEIMTEVALAVEDVGLLRHFPRVFHCWLQTVRNLSPGRFMEVMEKLQRWETVFDLSVTQALGEQSLGSRRSALEREKKRFGALVSAGRKDLEFFVSVRMGAGWDVEFVG